MDIVETIHDASIALGAECEQECPFYKGRPDAKAHTLTRAKALSLLTALTN